MHILLQTLSMPHAMLLNRVESANPPQQPKKKRLTGPELEDYLLFQSPGNKRIMYENRHQHPLVKDMLYTDGVKLFAEEGGQGGAYWFLDMVASEIFPLLQELQKDPVSAHIELLVTEEDDDDNPLGYYGYGALGRIFVFKYNDTENYWKTRTNTPRMPLNADAEHIGSTDMQTGKWEFVIEGNVLMLRGELGKH